LSVRKVARIRNRSRKKYKQLLLRVCFFPTEGLSKTKTAEKHTWFLQMLFSKEFTPEHTLGNELNAELGNISFQPFCARCRLW
jgi:hypothetical protein